MKMRSLEYFVALAESKSINEAAKKLYVAQPSLTKALQLLERELGVALFERTGTGIRLTEAGEKILPEARQVLRYYDRWRTLPLQGALRSIDLYTHISLSGFLLPDIIMDFKGRHPSLEISYNVALWPEGNVCARDDQPEMALSICPRGEGGEGRPTPGKCARTPLIRGEYGCLVSRQCALAQKSAVRVEELEEYFYIAPDLPALEVLADKQEFMTPIVHRVFSSITPDHTVRVGTVQNVIELVKKYPQGYALSCYPACLRYPAMQEGELAYIPFDSEGTGVDICLCYPRRAHREFAAVRELVRATQKAAREFCRIQGVPERCAVP